MADYFDYVAATGTILPDTTTLQTDVENEFKTAFGADLIVTPDTPQGMLIAAEVLARSTILRTIASIANQMNPDLAGGIFADALGALFDAPRKGEIFTTVTCNLTGVAGTIIPANSQAQMPSTGDVFKSQTTVTLNASGQANGVVFQAVNPGPIDVAPSTLTGIVSSVLGWETITNPLAGIPGSNTQNDSDYRDFRRATLAAQGNSLSFAIMSHLNQLAGVTSVSFRENYTSSPLVIDTKTLVANSIWVVVAGGLDQDIADTIVQQKTGGTNWNGSTSVASTDPNSGQVFNVLFDRPTIVNILIRVTVSVLGSVQDPQQAITNAILAYANGQVPGQKGFKIGEAVSCFELASSIDQQVSNIFIHKVETSLISPVSYSTVEIPMYFWQQAQVTSSSITVVVT